MSDVRRTASHAPLGIPTTVSTGWVMTFHVITNGLDPGDRVVTVGMQNLCDGTRVRIETAEEGSPRQREDDR